MRRFLNDAGAFKADNVLNWIAELTKFHRIQGSRELVEAAEFVKGELDNLGLESRLLSFDYDGKMEYLTLRSPVAWDLVEGRVEVLGRVLTTDETPLVVMAHSPSGIAEGSIVHVSKESDWNDVEGKVVLVGSDWRDAYRKANENGASGFIAYRHGTGKAFPYIGLFLSKDEMERARIPAVSIPENLATEVLRRLNSGEEVSARIEVEAELPTRQTLPVVYSTVGEPPFLLFTAHLCHPKPGANDNASGSAMLIELARVLESLHRPSFRFGFAFLWVPEYYGTGAFLGWVKSLGDYFSAINLDMVAGSPDRSGSTLMLVRTPLSRFSVVSGLLECYLELSNGRGSDLAGLPLPFLPMRTYPYESGSDHDLLNFFGIPAVMPITWPDRFYHSSEDTIDKVSRETVGIIGRAVLAAALSLSSADAHDLRHFSRGYAMKYLGEISMSGGSENARRLVLDGLARDSEFLGMDMGHRFEKKPWLVWRQKGVINGSFLREKGVPEEEIRKLSGKGVLTLLHELLMLGELLPRENAFAALNEEYGTADGENLMGFVESLGRAGVMEFSF